VSASRVRFFAFEDSALDSAVTPGDSVGFSGVDSSVRNESSSSSSFAVEGCASASTNISVGSERTAR